MSQEHTKPTNVRMRRRLITAASVLAAGLAGAVPTYYWLIARTDLFR